MKKIFSSLLMLMMAAASFAQIQAIAPGASNSGKISCDKGVDLLVDDAGTSFVLSLSSDNKADKQTVNLSLGSSAAEAISSLINLRDALRTKGYEFNIAGYDFTVVLQNKATTSAQGAVGVYAINVVAINKCIQKILSRYEVEVGEAEVTLARFATATSVYLSVKLPKYGIESTSISLYTDSSHKIADYVKGNAGDVLNKKQLQAIVKNIESGAIKASDDSAFFLKLAK